MSSPNRLATESSPYLLQHQHNPVEWYPWSEEAFVRAANDDKPIFLSIGYSTCHWCHVMERESFENREIATLMNAAFVSIKVDREERPDVDAIYMSVCQMMGGRCGWPLTVIMTPERKPFFVATYIPPEARHGRAGMAELVPAIQNAWEHDRERLLDSAQHIIEAVRSNSAGRSASKIDPDWLERAFGEFQQRFDEKHAGFAGPPKFPAAHNLMFLLRYGRRFDENAAIEMAESTLRAMRMGGIFDHIGFGYHRYSTDVKWLVPHFEKMLYDQAWMLLACADAFVATGDVRYQRIVSEVTEYLTRDLTSGDGTFMSAEDADSEGVEGKFYVWSVDEIQRVLPLDLANRFSAVFRIEREGNFEDESSQVKTGANIPYLGSSRENEMKPAVYGDPNDPIEMAREILFAEREKRIRPFKDDKVLVDWNGMMIAALARCGRAFANDAYVGKALRAVDWIWDNMRTEGGRLLHRYRNGNAAIEGVLDDYAYLAFANLEVFESSLHPEYLARALELTEMQTKLFADQDRGGFYFTSQNTSDLPVRHREFNDGAIPSGNAISVWNLARLSQITGRADLLDLAVRTAESAGQLISEYPSAYAGMLIGVDLLTDTADHIVIAGPRSNPLTQAMLEVANHHRGLKTVVMLRDPTVSPDLSDYAEFTRTQLPIDGLPAAYVCRDFACDTPVTSALALDHLMDELA